MSLNGEREREKGDEEREEREREREREQKWLDVEVGGMDQSSFLKRREAFLLERRGEVTHFRHTSLLYSRNEWHDS